MRGAKPLDVDMRFLKLSPILFWATCILWLGSHDQVFCTIFLHQSCEMWRKFLSHYCGQLPPIKLNSPCENENQCLESLIEFLGEIKRALFCQQVFKKPRFSMKKTELLAVRLKILAAEYKKCHWGQRRKQMSLELNKSRIGQNPERTKSRFGQNPNLDKIPIWTKSRMD